MSINPKQYSFQPLENVYNDFDSQGNPKHFPSDISNIPNGVNNKSDFHVNHLKSTFIDVARPNRFKVKIAPPRALSNDWNNETSRLLALVKTASFPQISIKEYVFERAGQKLYIPSNDVEFGDLSVTFTNDSKFTLRTMFNRWQKLAGYNWTNNVGTIPVLATDGVVTVYQYDWDLNPVYAVKFTNCWPKTISNIELSQESENVAEEFTVEFKYSKQEIFKDIGLANG